MRERLIELIGKELMDYASWETEMALQGNYNMPSVEEVIADKMLSDGWMKPPCKVGRTVWLKKSLNWQQTEWGIKEGKISMIQQKADKSWKFRITENHSVSDYTVDEIGKTVFLSREEAEKALEGGTE